MIMAVAATGVIMAVATIGTNSMNTLRRADRLGWANTLLGKLGFWTAILFPALFLVLAYYVWCSIVDPATVALFDKRLRQQVAEKKAVGPAFATK